MTTVSKAPRVLVADDDPTMRLLLQRAMQSENFEVILATNGEECLMLCLQYQPDLVLLDAVMPILNGFKCCATLKQQMGEGCPPILMITTLDDEKSVEKAFESGAIDYVTKPIHWSVLRYRVRRLLQMSWSMAEIQRLLHQLESANQELNRLNRLDSLTQIANRRHLDEVVEQEWQVALKDQISLSLILCDIDYFKQYNDIYGHLSGDTCLRQVAMAIHQAVSPSNGLVARYGGEEFAVLLPNTPLTEALKVAAKIQTKLHAQAIQHSRSDTGYVTISCGVSSLIPQPHLAIEALIEAADQALYQAKARGRNQVVPYEPSSTVVSPCHLSG